MRMFIIVYIRSSRNGTRKCNTNRVGERIKNFLSYPIYILKYRVYINGKRRNKRTKRWVRIIEKVRQKTESWKE